jgi:hypothetical protein
MSTASAKKMARTKTPNTPKPTSRKGLKCPDAPKRIRIVARAIMAANRIRSITAALANAAPRRMTHREMPQGFAYIIDTQAALDARH